MKRATLAALLLSAAVGCATMGGLREHPLDTGTTRTYAADYATVTAATRAALLAAGLDVEDSYSPAETTLVLLAKRSSGFWSWGEIIRVVVEETEPGVTAVRVISKRRSAINVTAKGDWSETVFANIELHLGQGDL